MNATRASDSLRRIKTPLKYLSEKVNGRDRQPGETLLPSVGNATSTIAETLTLRLSVEETFGLLTWILIAAVGLVALVVFFLLCRRCRRRRSTVTRSQVSFMVRCNYRQESTSRPSKNKPKEDPFSLRPVYKWSFLDSDGSWKLQGGFVAGVSSGLYASMLLEAAYRRKELDGITLETGGQTYKYSVAGTKLLQTNTRTGVTRLVKRELVAIEDDLPKDWMPMIRLTSGGSRVVAVPVSDEEYGVIEELFKNNGGIPESTVKKIFRVQNDFFRIRMASKMKELAPIYRDAGVTIQEMFLFHGTRTEAVKSICEQNFDWRRSGENVGTKFGRGVYFAKKPSTSHEYAAPNANGTRFMFVAQVLVGLTCLGNPDMKYPPEWKSGVNYDTAVNNVSSPEIFVKFDNQEYIPVFLIEYGV